MTGALLDEDEEQEAPDDDLGSAELTERAFERERLAAAWTRLHVQHRVVLSLHEIEGYSLEEVAKSSKFRWVPPSRACNRARKSSARIVDRGNEFPRSGV